MRTSALRKPVEEEVDAPSTADRKPAASEGRKPDLFVPLPQDSVIPLIDACDRCYALLAICLYVSKLANRRACSRTIEGWTSPVTTAELAESLHFDQNTIEWSLRKGADGNFPVLDYRTAAEAEKDGLIPRGEKGRRRGGIVIRLLVENWEPAARLVLESREAEEKPKRHKQPKEVREAIPITPEPLLLMPGEKSRPVPLSPTVRRALGECAQFDPGELPLALKLSPVIEGNVFRLKWQPTAETKSQPIVTKDSQVFCNESESAGLFCVDCENGVPFAAGSKTLHASGQKCSKPECIVTSDAQLLSFLDSVFAEVGIAKSPDKLLLGGILKRLNGTPLERFERIVRERVKEVKENGGKFYPKLCLKLAEDAAYTHGVRGDREPVIPISEPDPYEGLTPRERRAFDFQFGRK